jgi:hypothetical protein
VVVEVVALWEIKLLAEVLEVVEVALKVVILELYLAVQETLQAHPQVKEVMVVQEQLLVKFLLLLLEEEVVLVKQEQQEVQV